MLVLCLGEGDLFDNAGVLAFFKFVALPLLDTVIVFALVAFGVVGRELGEDPLSYDLTFCIVCRVFLLLRFSCFGKKNRPNLHLTGAENFPELVFFFDGFICCRRRDKLFCSLGHTNNKPWSGYNTCIHCTNQRWNAYLHHP